MPEGQPLVGIVKTGAGVTIRNARPEDGEAIARVQIKAWQSAYAHIFPPEKLASLDEGLDALADRWRSTILASDRMAAFLVAVEASGEVIGFAAAAKQLVQEFPYETDLQVIYLLPQYQHTGIGRQLMRAIAAALIQAGYKSMMLWVLRENRDARLFYEKLGGQPVGESDYERWGETYEIVAYGWQDFQRLLEVC